MGVINFSNATIGGYSPLNNQNYAIHQAFTQLGGSVSLYNENYTLCGSVTCLNKETTTHDGVTETVYQYAISGSMTKSGNQIRLAGNTANNPCVYINVPFQEGDTGSFAIKLTVPSP